MLYLKHKISKGGRKMKIGYVRVSTQEQNEGRQTEAFSNMGVDKLFVDKLSGKNLNRPQLAEMLAYIREGDIVVVESISRLARNTRDLLDIVEKIKNKGASFVSLKESIDTDSVSGKFMLTIFAAMAELERGYILERQAEGIALAKREGKYKGRAPIAVDEEKFRKVCARWREGKISAVQAMAELELKPNTFYRKVKKMGL
jgi:DNA invertase Pin-like site-specific DNA recombinase